MGEENTLHKTHKHKHTHTKHTQQIHIMSKVNLTGEWKLDAKASEDLDGILKLSGKGFLQRKVMGNIKSVTQELKHDGDKLFVKIITSVKEVNEEVDINGETVEKSME